MDSIHYMRTMKDLEHSIKYYGNTLTIGLWHLSHSEGYWRLQTGDEKPRILHTSEFDTALLVLLEQVATID